MRSKFSRVFKTDSLGAEGPWIGPVKWDTRREAFDVLNTGDLLGAFEVLEGSILAWHPFVPENQNAGTSTALAAPKRKIENVFACEGQVFGRDQFGNIYHHTGGAAFEPVIAV